MAAMAVADFAHEVRERAALRGRRSRWPALIAPRSPIAGQHGDPRNSRRRRPSDCAWLTAELAPSPRRWQLPSAGAEILSREWDGSSWRCAQPASLTAGEHVGASSSVESDPPVRAGRSALAISARQRARFEHSPRGTLAKSTTLSSLPRFSAQRHAPGAATRCPVALCPNVDAAGVRSIPPFDHRGSSWRSVSPG